MWLYHIVFVILCSTCIYFTTGQESHHHTRFGINRYGPIRSPNSRPYIQSKNPSTYVIVNNKNNDGVSQHQHRTSCTLPVFSDAAQFSLDECEQENNRHPICQGQLNQRVPSLWMGTMHCSSRTISVKFASTCSQSGEWNPPFLSSCADLFQQSIKTFSSSEPQAENESSRLDNVNQNQDLQSPSFSSTFLTGENGNPQRQQQQQDLEGVKSQSQSQDSQNYEVETFRIINPDGGLPCFQLRFQMDSRFIFSCVFPGRREESECLYQESVESGTRAILKCKSPYKSVTGKPNMWLCQDGAWSAGENKLLCSYTVPIVVSTESFTNNSTANQAPQRQDVQHQEKEKLPQSQLLPTVTQAVPKTVVSDAEIPKFVETQKSSPNQINYGDTKIRASTTLAPLVLPIDIRKDIQHSNIYYPNPIAQDKKVEPLNSGGSQSPSSNDGQFSLSNSKPNKNSNINNVNKFIWPSNNNSNRLPIKVTPELNNNNSFTDQGVHNVLPFVQPSMSSSALSFSNNNNKPSQYSSFINPSTSVLNQTSNNNNNSPVIMCPLLLRRHKGVKIECVFKQNFVSTSNCEAPVPVGTEARYYCDDYYETTVGLTTLFRKCKEDGTWTGVAGQFSCIESCGKSNAIRVPFIIHGSPSVRGQWPWNAALFLDDRGSIGTTKWSFICGGTLISTSAIVTAAHCVTLLETSTKRQESTLRVDLGKYFRETVDEIVQSRRVKKIVVHPSYSPYGFDSDIAILILDEPIKLSYHVQPICFPQSTETAIEELHLSPNSYGTVVGWGRDETGKLADRLKITSLPVVSARDCLENVRDSLATQLQTRSTTFCAGFSNGTANVCNGDSGAGFFFPSTASGQTRWYLQGIVSIGIPKQNGECDPTKYSVFTRVGRYADFIVRTISEN